MQQGEARCHKNIQSSVKGYLLSMGAGFFAFSWKVILLHQCLLFAVYDDSIETQAVGTDLYYYSCVIIREYFCKHSISDRNIKSVELLLQLESAIYS